jgi:flavin-binding protein dodecin
MAGRHCRRSAIPDSGTISPSGFRSKRRYASFQCRYPDVSLVGGRSACLLPNTEREDDMSESVYKVIELIGTSKESWEKAAAAALERAGKSLRDLRVAEVVKLDLQLDAKGKVEAYRAKLNVSFKFED